MAWRREPLPPRRDVPRLVLCGLLWFGAYYVLLNEAERRVDAGTAAMLVNVGPILIAVRRIPAAAAGGLPGGVRGRDRDRRGHEPGRAGRRLGGGPVPGRRGDLRVRGGGPEAVARADERAAGDVPGVRGGSGGVPPVRA